MISVLRRFRWIPALLLACSPALGGVVLPLVHPCPVEAPWRDQGPATASATGHSHDHHQTAPSHDHGSGGPCTCLGACHSVVAPDLPTAPEVAVAVSGATAQHNTWPRIDSGHGQNPADLLPPKTAPPIV